TAGEVAHVAGDLLGGEAEAGENRVRARLEVVATELLVASLNFAESLDNVGEVGGLVVVEPSLEILHLFAEPPGLAGAGERFGEDAPPLQIATVLPEVADGQALRLVDDTIVRLLVTDDEAKDRALARAIRADQADLLAFAEVERRIDEENLTAVLLADVRE